MNRQRPWRSVWTLLVAASAFYLLADNEADNDLWVHVRLGIDILTGDAVPRFDSWSYTAAGAPLIDHEWLLHALFGSLYLHGGSTALLLCKLVVGLATVALLALSVARHATMESIRGVALLLAIAGLARGFAVRPQIVTYLFLAALWLFLDRPAWRDSTWRWLLVPAFVLWANLHGGVILGLGIAGLCGLWLLASRPRDGALLLAAVSASAAAALWLNPYGFAYAGFLVRELGAPHPITEWQPVALEAAQATFFALAAAFLVTLPFLGQWRERGWQILLAAGLLLAALLQQRHTPAFAICAAPLVAEGAEACFRRYRARIVLPGLRLSLEALRLLAIGMIALALVQVALATQRLLGDEMQIVYAPRDYPVEAVRRLASSHAELNLAVPLEWGGYAAWHLGPEVKVSLDGRFAMVYAPQVVEDNFAFFSGRDDWKRLIDAYPTDAVLAPSEQLPPLDTTGDAAPWRVLFRDDVATLIVRRDAALPGPLPELPHENQAGLFP